MNQYSKYIQNPLGIGYFPDNDLPWWKYEGHRDLRELQRRHLVGMMLTLERFSRKTGLMIGVIEFNRAAGPLNRHPEGTHVKNDGDFRYFPDLSDTFRLWVDLFEAFPGRKVMTRRETWAEMTPLIPPILYDKYYMRVMQDEMPEWNHCHLDSLNSREGMAH